MQVAATMGPGHRVVTILCDGGQKYQSRLYARDWLTEKGLLAAADSGRERGEADRGGRATAG